MHAFEWNTKFETGQPDVDQQHHALVDLTNQLGYELAKHAAELDVVDRIFKELAEYALFHFGVEEDLMESHGVDSRHLTHHINEHKIFFDKVVKMKAEVTTENQQAAPKLLVFLCSWLADHILIVDQEMVRQIRLIESGLSPAEAYEQDTAGDFHDAAQCG